jgi:hypothetical protein
MNTNLTARVSSVVLFVAVALGAVVATGAAGSAGAMPCQHRHHGTASYTGCR